MNLVEVISHPFFMSFYGIILWFTLLWSIAKNKADKAGEKFSGKEWRTRNYDDFIVAILVGFAVVAFDDEVLAAYNHWQETDYHMQPYYYLASGPIAHGLYSIVTKFTNHG